MFRESAGSSPLENVPEEKTKNTYEIVENELHPETITDADGIERTIFTFHDASGTPVKVLFYGREELPNLPDKENTFSFGQGPRFRSEKDKMDFKERVVRHHGRRINPELIDKRLVEKGDGLFFVEQSPQALLDMAIALGVNTEEVRKMRKLAFERNASDELETFVDGVIAGNTLDDQGEYKKPDNMGEALSLLMLQGNESAREIISKKKAILDEKFQQVRDAQVESLKGFIGDKEKGGEPLKIDELVGVHLTRYMPKRDKRDGAWHISNSYEATKGRNPRITQHFTLNHAVESAGLYGNWKNTPIAVITPLKTMIEKNGKPSVLNTIDTFWEVSPGRDTVLPSEEAVVVAPDADLPSGELSRRRGNEVVYKTANFSKEDLTTTIQRIEPRDHYWFKKDLYKAFLEGISEFDVGGGMRNPVIPLDQVHRIARVFGVPEKEYESALFDFVAMSNELPHELENASPREFILKVLETAQVTLGEESIERILNGINKDIARRNKYFTIDQVIKELGYEVHGGGMWAWDGDSWEATAQTQKLGVEMGIPVMAHFHHDSSEQSHAIAKHFNEILDSSKPALTTNNCKPHFAQLYLPTASPQARRMMYEVGLL